jgi:hypothetical protein
MRFISKRSRMKKIYGILALAIGIVIFSCSSRDSTDAPLIPPNFDSTDSGNPNNPSSPSNFVSSSSFNITTSSPSSPSSSSRAASSSSQASTPSCVYQTSWCGNAAASNVKTASLNSATGSGICTFATAVAMLGNFNDARVNGTKIDKCGKSEWGQQACTTVLASIAKADGGYYIYAPDYYAEFTTTGGTPNCSGGGITPGVSSSAGTSSNSGGGTSSNSNNGGSPSYTPTAPGTETSKLTHYWDACKPSCSWSGKGGIQANACNITGSKIGHDDNDKSSCDGGTAFMCMNQAPWKVGNVSFGYVAAAVGNCGDCYQFDFPNGQVMVVMANNHGDIHEGAKFDLMVPGGGVGDFDALTRQIQQVGGISNPNMGERYGGFRGACGWSYSPTAVTCVKQKCESVFANMPDLKAGCLWYANTLGTSEADWNNPTVKYKKVTCPSELTSKY